MALDCKNMYRVVRQEVIPPNEKGGGKIITRPDMAPSLGTMLNRFRKGLPVDFNQKKPVYNGDEDLPNLKKMDLTEIDEYSRNLKDKVKNLSKDEQDIKKRRTQQLWKSKQKEASKANDAI